MDPPFFEAFSETLNFVESEILFSSNASKVNNKVISLDIDAGGKGLSANFSKRTELVVSSYRIADLAVVSKLKTLLVTLLFQ